VTGEDALRCNTNENVTCVFMVSTLNCGFVKSDPLEFVTISANQANQTTALLTHISNPPDRDVPDSSFFNFFRFFGLAGLLECFFCIFGLVLKIAFLTECRTDRVERVMASSHNSITNPLKSAVIYNGNSD
jgi:hypothetical protein